jgi:phage host-nuclease inhibitor protein Gam
MKTKKTKTIELPQTPDFQKALDLLEALGEATDEITNITAITNNHLRSVLRDIKPKYAHNQERATIAEQLLETLCRKHPEWFEQQKTLKTLFGTLSLRSSTELEVPNEDAAIARLERDAFARFPGDDKVAEYKRAEYLARYTRTKIGLNKEALEREDNTFLSLLGISRVTKENFSAKPASINLAKATEPEQQKAA